MSRLFWLKVGTKNNPSGHKQSSQNDVKIEIEIDSHPLDPINVLEFYLQKIHPENPNLFAKRKKLFSKVDEIWYMKEVIGKNTLVNIMKTFSGKAGLNQIYTNHCVHASTVTHLEQAGVDDQQICSITKHKNELTLSHYISSKSDKQKTDASRILSSTFVPSSTKAMEPQSTSSMATSPSCHELDIQHICYRTSHLMQSVMPNGIFNNGTISFQRRI